MFPFWDPNLRFVVPLWPPMLSVSLVNTSPPVLPYGAFPLVANNTTSSVMTSRRGHLPSMTVEELHPDDVPNHPADWTATNRGWSERMTPECRDGEAMSANWEKGLFKRAPKQPIWVPERGRTTPNRESVNLNWDKGVFKKAPRHPIWVPEISERSPSYEWMKRRMKRDVGFSGVVVKVSKSSDDEVVEDAIDLREVKKKIKIRINKKRMKQESVSPTGSCSSTDGNRRHYVSDPRVASKMGLGPAHGSSLPFFCHNGEHLTQPPPAHMGIPPYQLDPKGTGPMGEYWRGLGLGLRSPPAPPPPPVAANTPGMGISPGDWKRLGPLLAASGLARPPMYPFSASQYPYPMLSPEMTQVASWHTPSMYPISTGGGGFRSPYPTSLPITSSAACLTSDLYRFSPTGLLPPHPGLSPHSPHPHSHAHAHPHAHPHSLASHPAIVTPGPKQELGQDHHTHHRQSSIDQKNSTNSDNSKNQDQSSANNQDKKKPHIKKPLNAFMLYMKEMRAKVVAECTLKESAAINQILGRRWHALGREEQAKYYELARRERQLHMQLYPDWSSRANTTRGKKRKRKQDTNDGGNSMKKCRARYGLDQQSQWCKPCRRKKKCIRYMEAGDSVDGNQSEDNLGSCGSVGEAQTPPDDDTESLHHSISSPGGLSGLSSLTSPSMILPSPSTSLASPSVSLASPCMSLQSPLTPQLHHDSIYDCKPQMMAMPLPLPIPHRNPVGTNPHDVNNPLSVNQLTGQCVKSEKDSRSVIGVT